MSEMRSNVYCTNCTREFIAVLDLSLSGNHEIVCPHCQHVHYRVVRDGAVTEDRWASRWASSAGPTFRAVTSITVYTANTTNSTSTWTIDTWLNGSTLDLVT